MRYNSVLLVCAAIITSAGCASTTPEYDKNFGKAVLVMRAQQTINPDASKNTDPVSGLDGQSASDAMERYHDSFKTPPPTFNVINIGGGLTAK